MSSTLVVRPIHLPAFEAIPELSPVFDYTTASTTHSQANEDLLLSSSSSTSSCSSSTLIQSPLYRSLSSPSPSPSLRTSQPRQRQQHQKQLTEYFALLGRESSHKRSSDATARSQHPPLSTDSPPQPTPFSAYPIYPGLQTCSSSKNLSRSSSSSSATATCSAMSVTMERRNSPRPRVPLNRPPKLATSRSRDASPVSSAFTVPTSQSNACSTTQQQQRQHLYYHQYQQQLYRQQSSSLQYKLHKKRTRQPNELFSRLPSDVLEVVLDCLKALHLEPGSDSCATCWMRDLCNLSVASRAWSKVARLALYRDIQIVGFDSPPHRKKFFFRSQGETKSKAHGQKNGCRMTLLRRTLRANAHLAAAVRSLTLPSPERSANATGQDGELISNKSDISLQEAYENRIAALVMACPNLEVLVGPITKYSHGTFDRITHALSTRKNLKTMHWRIEALVEGSVSSSSSPTRSSHHKLPRLRKSSSSLFSSLSSSSSSTSLCGSSNSLVSSSGALSFKSRAPPLDISQEIAFLDNHRAWTSLTTLSIDCLPGSSLAPDTLLQRALACLPALQHLHLSRLPADAFSDATLLALPPLHSLLLSHLPGVTDAGLSALATRPNSQALRSLRLYHTGLSSLPALARLLSRLYNLTSLAVVQDFPPLMPSNGGGGGGGGDSNSYSSTDGDNSNDDCGAFALWMMPYLASSTLTRLHWDVSVAAAPSSSSSNRASDADDVLARSIEAGGFPALRTLRAPSDPDGILQALCRPVETIATPSDRMWADNNGQRCRRGSSGSSSDSGSESRSNSSRSKSIRSSFRRPFGAAITPTITTNLPKSATSSSLPQLHNHHRRGTDLRAARLAAQARIDAARHHFRFRVNVCAEDGLVTDTFGLGGFVGTVGSPIRYRLDADPGSSDEHGGLVDVMDLGDGDVGADGGVDGRDEGYGTCSGAWNRCREGFVADRLEEESWWHAPRRRRVEPRLD